MDVAPSPLNDDFLLTLVHDLRANVRRSLTGVQLIERSLGERLDAPMRQRFDQVIASNRTLESFLSRLSDYANAASLRKSKPLPLPAVIQAARLQFPEQSIDLDPLFDQATHVELPQEAVKMFCELIDNAIKFSKNGTVKMEINSEKEDETRITIHDLGIGIPPGHKERVFDLLFRLHSNDEYPGFGLGLPICRRIADLIGAHISLAANPKGGTIASVTIQTLD